MASIRVSTIDVGKGDCILVQVGGSSLLIDTGYEETSGKVVAYLRGQGVDRLTCVIITHYDRDHIGGLRAVCQAFEVETVFLPPYEGADKQYRSVMKAVSDLGLPARRLDQELVLTLGHAEARLMPSRLVYVPDAKGDEGNDNDLSTVVTLTAGKDAYLFTGDLEEEGIEAYVAGGHGTFGVLKVPNHGKRAKNIGSLLSDVRPQVAIITDGDKDRADKKTLKSFDDARVDVYRTSERGTIVVESDGSGAYTVTTEQ